MKEGSVGEQARLGAIRESGGQLTRLPGEAGVRVKTRSRKDSELSQDRVG